MPSDYLVAMAYGPAGLMASGVAFALIWGIWRLFLGQEYSRVGMKPLLAGMGAFFLAVLAYCMVSASIEYTGRVIKVPGIGGYWDIVPGWTLYLFAILLFFLLFFLCLIFVPAAALLARRDRLTWPNVLLILTVVWLLAALLHGLFPTNQWGRENRLIHFWQAATGTAVVIWPAFGGFLAAVGLTVRRRQSVPLAPAANGSG